MDIKGKRTGYRKNWSFLISSLGAEDRVDEIVLRVNGTEDSRVVSIEVSNEPVGEHGEEVLVGVETIDRLDEFSTRSSRLGPVIHELLSGQVVVDELEVLEGVAAIVGLSDNLTVLLVEKLSMSSGSITNGGVGVEPSPARISVVAVEEVVEISVGDTSANGVHMVVQDIVEDASISETNHDDIGLGRKALIHLMQNFVNV